MYHIVHVPENAAPSHLTVDSADQLRQWFEQLNDLNCHVFVFKGERLYITKGVFRYLLDGDQAIPLFTLPSPGAPSAEASLEELANLDTDYANLTPKFPSEEEDYTSEEDESES